MYECMYECMYEYMYEYMYEFMYAMSICRLSSGTLSIFVAL